MNWEQIEVMWKQLRWGNDRQTIAGKKDLADRIQERYGFAKAEAERQADERSRALKQPESGMLAGLLAPVAALAGALGVWRFGANSGWTNHFFIAKGLLSHWQAWFAVAIGVHTSSRSLNKWLERHVGATNNDKYFSD